MTRTMRRRLADALRAIVLVGLLAGSLAGCGKYGPPEPYPPEAETSEDEEERR